MSRRALLPCAPFLLAVSVSRCASAASPATPPTGAEAPGGGPCSRHRSRDHCEDIPDGVERTALPVICHLSSSSCPVTARRRWLLQSTCGVVRCMGTTGHLCVTLVCNCGVRRCGVPQNRRSIEDPHCNNSAQSCPVMPCHALSPRRPIPLSRCRSVELSSCRALVGPKGEVLGRAAAEDCGEGWVSLDPFETSVFSSRLLPVSSFVDWTT